VLEKVGFLNHDVYVYTQCHSDILQIDELISYTVIYYSYGQIITHN